MRCTHCEEEFEADSDGRYNTDGDWYCTDCYDDKYTTCDSCGCEVVSDDAFEYEAEYFCEECEDSQFFTCSHCGDREHLGDGTTIRNGDRVCEECDGRYYTLCDCCDEVVPDGDWCSNCETCDECCTCHYCEDCDTHTDDCTCEEPGPEIATPCVPLRAPSPPVVSPFRDSGGSPVALIERLDNSKFELLPSNVTKVLGMLDKDGTLRASGIMGRPCTGDSSYYRIGDIISEVGKVADPIYIYGVRSNEYDIVISTASQNDTVDSKLRSLGLSYTYASSSAKEKVGLSFKVRKRKYRKCIEFLKFYCNI